MVNFQSNKSNLLIFLVAFVLISGILLPSISKAEETAQLATLNIIKHVVNDNDGTATSSDFTMSVKITATGENVSGSPAFGMEAPGRAYVLEPGTYTVSEGALLGYTQTYSGDCVSDPNDVHLGQITLAAGDNKICTITNDDFGTPPPNQAPVWSGPNYASTTLGSGFDLTILATDPDNDELTVTSTIPTGASYNASSGSFMWTPTEAGTSTAFFSASDLATSTDFILTLEVFNISTSTPLLHVIKHVVNDNGGTATSSDFTIYVKITASGENVSGSPAFGLEFPGRAYALSPDTYTITEGALLNYNQIYSGDCISDPNDVHLGQIILIAGDNKTCTITNNDVGTSTENLPPYFVNFNPSLTATATLLYSYDVDAADPENDPLRFYLEGAPAGMTIASSTGLIEWVPAENQVTSTPYAVKVAVSDGLHATSTSYSIVVNPKPAVLPQCSDGIDNDGDGKIDMADPGCANTSDNDETDPSGGGGGGGVIVVPPGGGGGGSQNYPPRFRDFNPPIFATATELYAYDVDAYDLENDPITYSFNKAPQGMVISVSTGLITWYPTLSQVSVFPYEIIVVISDGRGAVSASFLVTVVTPTYIPPPPFVIMSPVPGEVLGEVTATTTPPIIVAEEEKCPSFLVSLLTAISKFGVWFPLYLFAILVLLCIILYLVRKNRKLRETLAVLEEKKEGSLGYIDIPIMSPESSGS